MQGLRSDTRVHGLAKLKMAARDKTGLAYASERLREAEILQQLYKLLNIRQMAPHQLQAGQNVNCERAVEQFEAPNLATFVAKKHAEHNAQVLLEKFHQMSRTRTISGDDTLLQNEILSFLPSSDRVSQLTPQTEYQCFSPDRTGLSRTRMT